jgi:GNAT superfamily N-acetyltransferase
MDCSPIVLQIHQPIPATPPIPTPGSPWGVLPPSSLSPGLDLVQLQALFRLTAHWAPDRTLEDLRLALGHSNPVVSASLGDRLVGFSRATSDGVYRATIWDVIVHPDFQGGGIGRKLVQTVLSHPHVNRVERIYLMTSHKQHFYEHIGFQVNDTTTMVLHNRPLTLGASQEMAAGVPAWIN